MVELEWRDETVTEVEPVDEAPDVGFPWAQAKSLLADIDSMAFQLGGELTLRALMVDGPDGEGGLTDWEGPFRTEFNGMDDTYTTQTEEYRDSLLSAGDVIFQDAKDAAETQRQLNEDHAELATEDSN